MVELLRLSLLNVRVCQIHFRFLLGHSPLHLVIPFYAILDSLVYCLILVELLIGLILKLLALVRSLLEVSRALVVVGLTYDLLVDVREGSEIQF